MTIFVQKGQPGFTTKEQCAAGLVDLHDEEESGGREGRTEEAKLARVGHWDAVEHRFVILWCRCHLLRT